MQKFKYYHQYTDYDKEPGGLRKLDFIVQTLEKDFYDQKKSEIKILDVGCGRGNISLPLASCGYRVLGIDVDTASILDVQQKNKFSNAKFLTFRAEEIKTIQLNEEVINFIQFKKKENKKVFFDCVIASEIFEHLSDPGKFAQEIFQILSINGILIASIPNGGSLLENFRWFLNQTKIGRAIKRFLFKKILKRETILSYGESPHLQFFSLRRFEKILKKAGFKIQKIKNSSVIFGETFYLFWRFFLRRGSKIFNIMDSLDNKLSDIIPKNFGVGWIIVAKK